MSAKLKSIFVTGDIANDYFLIRGERFFSDDHNPDHIGTHIVNLKGGASLIFELLEQIASTRQADPDKEQLELEFGYTEEVFNILPGINKGYVSVRQYSKEKSKIWRIDEFVGFGNDKNGVTDYTPFQKAGNDLSDIFIIDDAGMNFSLDDNKVGWSSMVQTIRGEKNNDVQPFVILKKSGDFNNNELFDELINISKEKKINLLTVLSIDDVRKLDVKVSSGLSWEQSASDLVAGLNTNENLRYLAKSNFLVITFQSSGAMFVVNDGNNNFEYFLIFDPENMEGEDENNSQGKIIGKMSFFTAVFASQLNLAKKDKYYKIENAIKAGLSSIRLFYNIGYKNTESIFYYPFKEVAEALIKAKEFSYSMASIPGYDTPSDGWSILIDNYSEKQAKQEVQIKALTALAKNIVYRGPDILKNVPSGKFGNLFTVDRSEIESLRNLKKIMESYIKFDDGKKPLSIAVFGPPGAGKSFAVEEIGKGILGDNFPKRAFNLSQFSNPDDLNGALHQVRDSIIEKKTPIVFWDEFDSQSYKWLQYLLAPMQDGAFQEGQITHKVGKCIFIFAGATSYSMSAFGKFKTEEENKAFLLKKGPDFISRLNGYINILGPNKRQLFNDNYDSEEEKWLDDPTDITYPVRRAIFILSLLRLKKADFPVTMDWGLLNALIKVDRYKHGSRSMANLLTDIRQNNPKNLLLRSWLPSKATLELYFNNLKDFYDCMTKESDFLEMAWEIAPLIHSFWMNNIKDPFNQYSVEFSFLPVFIKESNVHAAKRIPKVLEAGGFTITTKDASGKLSNEKYLAIINDNDKSVLKKMAEKEHDLWWEFYTVNGWKNAKIRNDYAKKHNCMIPYSKLSEDDKVKDIGLISTYPEIVNKAGFGIAIK